MLASISLLALASVPAIVAAPLGLPIVGDLVNGLPVVGPIVGPILGGLGGAVPGGLPSLPIGGGSGGLPAVGGIVNGLPVVGPVVGPILGGLGLRALPDVQQTTAQLLSTLYASLPFRGLVPGVPVFCQNPVSADLTVTVTTIASCAFPIASTLGAQITPAIEKLIGSSAVQPIDLAVNAICAADPTGSACKKVVALVQDIVRNPASAASSVAKISQLLSILCSSSILPVCPAQLPTLPGMTCNLPILGSLPIIGSLPIVGGLVNGLLSTVKAVTCRLL